MFTVDYEIGGAAQAHDHPFEEAYFFLEGQVEGEIDGADLPPSDRATSCSRVSGSVHGFYNVGNGRVRWIETQAPQPPARHAYRWVGELEALRGGEHDDRTTGAVVVVGGTRAIGLEIARHFVERGPRGRAHRARRRRTSRTAVAGARWATSDGRHVRPRRADIDRAGPGRVGPGPAPCRWSAIDRDAQHVADYDIARAIRLVTLKLVGYTEVVHALLDRLTDDVLHRAVRWAGQGSSVPGLHDRQHRQRRDRGPDPHPRPPAQADPGQLHPSGDRRRQPVLGGEAGGPRGVPRETPDRADCRPWPRSSARSCSCSRTRAINGVDLMVDGGIGTADLSPRARSRTAQAACDLRRGRHDPFRDRQPRSRQPGTDTTVRAGGPPRSPRPMRPRSGRRPS